MKDKKELRRMWSPLLNTLGLFSSDPLGSYTGIPEELEDVPEQDADDL